MAEVKSSIKKYLSSKKKDFEGKIVVFLPSEDFIVFNYNPQGNKSARVRVRKFQPSVDIAAEQSERQHQDRNVSEDKKRLVFF